QWIYWGWQPVAELAPDNVGGVDLMLPQKLFTWGLDLLGLNGQTNSLYEAGGIGGLLASYDTGADLLDSTTDDREYAHFYDGNGNIGQLMRVDNNAIVAA